VLQIHKVSNLLSAFKRIFVSKWVAQNEPRYLVLHAHCYWKFHHFCSW